MPFYFGCILLSYLMPRAIGNPGWPRWREKNPSKREKGLGRVFLQYPQAAYASVKEKGHNEKESRGREEKDHRSAFSGRGTWARHRWWRVTVEKNLLIGFRHCIIDYLLDWPMETNPSIFVLYNESRKNLYIYLPLEKFIEINEKFRFY